MFILRDVTRNPKMAGLDRFIEIAKYSLVDIEDPVNLVPVVLLFLCLIWSGKPRGWLSLWALFNGCIIHCWMDG